MNFCLRDLDLKKPIYQRTASYGHFGRDLFSWEIPKKLKYWGTLIPITHKHTPTVLQINLLPSSPPPLWFVLLVYQKTIQLVFVKLLEKLQLFHLLHYSFYLFSIKN